jgi:ABC-2 type transport system ATP-binding protein
MRLILGLDAPDGGQALVDGKQYRDHPAPLAEVGALLEARSLHPGRSAYNHLLSLAQTHGVGPARVRELIEMVGLESVARKRAGTFSLGMTQRLGIASALLCDPRVAMFDEPINGLDVEGIQWVRNLLKQLAAEGRTVFVSSHLMSEMSLTAEHLIVIGRGQLLADMPVDEFVRRASKQSVRVCSPQSDELARLLVGPDVTVESLGPGLVEVIGIDSKVVGETAAEHNIVLYELTPQQASLEEAYVELTRDDVEFHAATVSAPPELEEAQA